MSQFRAKRLDLGGFINARVIRDHTKRKVYEQFEPERYASLLFSSLLSMQCTGLSYALIWHDLKLTSVLSTSLDKPSATPFAIHRYLNECAPKPSCNSLKCTPIPAQRRSRIDAWPVVLQEVFSEPSDLVGCVVLLSFFPFSLFGGVRVVRVVIGGMIGEQGTG